MGEAGRAELSDEQWMTETRLPGWTVRDVYVHVTPDVLIAMLAAPAADGDAKVTSAAEMLRVFNADRPRPNRCTHSSPRWSARWRPAIDRDSVVQRFGSDLPDAFERLTGLSRYTVIPHPSWSRCRSAPSSIWRSWKRRFIGST
ncbi:hypothetical protein GTA09_09025 [Rhodococcus hoagii]|nr:hypothetical protein [Prescottella equi]